MNVRGKRKQRFYLEFVRAIGIFSFILPSYSALFAFCRFIFLPKCANIRGLFISVETFIYVRLSFRATVIHFLRSREFSSFAFLFSETLSLKK